MRKIVSIILTLLSVAVCCAQESVSLTNEQWMKIKEFVTVELTKSKMSLANGKDKEFYEKVFKNIGDGTVECSGFEEFNIRLYGPDGEHWGSTKKDPWQKMVDFDDEDNNLVILYETIKGLKGYNEDVEYKIKSQIDVYVQSLQTKPVVKQNKVTKEPQIKNKGEEKQDGKDTPITVGKTEKQDSKCEGGMGGFFIGLLLGIVSVVTAIYVFVRKGFLNIVLKGKRDEEEDTVKEEVAVDDENVKLRREIESLKNTIKDYERQEERLSRISDLQNKTQEKVVKSDLEKEEKVEVKVEEKIEEKKDDVPAGKWRYLRRLKGDAFLSLSDVMEYDCYYILNESTMEFKFANDNTEGALMNASSTFPQTIVDKVSGNSFNAKKVINVEPGKIEKVDGEWKVVKKVKLKFE